MTQEEFVKHWKETYPNSPPVGYLLRETYPDIWFRIHSLPSSKRYAETENDYEEILKRHNLILSDLLGKGSNYILITTTYSSNKLPEHDQSQIDILAVNKQYLSSLAKHELEESDEPYYWHFFMTEMNWEEKSIDNLLKLVADEELRDIQIVGVEQNCVYHPYDGGADIFMKDELKRNLVKSKYSSWLSTHPLGL